MTRRARVQESFDLIVRPHTAVGELHAGRRWPPSPPPSRRANAAARALSPLRTPSLCACDGFSGSCRSRSSAPSRSEIRRHFNSHAASLRIIASCGVSASAGPRRPPSTLVPASRAHDTILTSLRTPSGCGAVHCCRSRGSGHRETSRPERDIAKPDFFFIFLTIIVLL